MSDPDHPQLADTDLVHPFAKRQKGDFARHHLARQPKREIPGLTRLWHAPRVSGITRRRRDRRRRFRVQQHLFQEIHGDLFPREAHALLGAHHFLQRIQIDHLHGVGQFLPDRHRALSNGPRGFQQHQRGYGRAKPSCPGRHVRKLPQQDRQQTLRVHDAGEEAGGPRHLAPEIL